MRRIGFITSAEEGLNGDDQLCVTELEKQGISVSPIVWDQGENQNLKLFDALVFRSCWNYHQKYFEFLEWIRQLRILSIPVFNPLSVIEWNINKKYLLDWDSAPGTIQFLQGHVFSKTDFEAVLSRWRSESVVIKPSVSLNGQDTFLIDRSNFENKINALRPLFESRDMLVQEFIPEIRTSGETSAVFFNKRFSHAIKKLPAAGEFRIHREYGGQRNPVQISTKALTYAESVIRRIPNELLYARVDLVERESDCVLIEIELTDPMLYLQTDLGSAKRFADAIVESVSFVYR